MKKHYRTLMAWPAALLFAMAPVSFAAAARMPSSYVSVSAGTGTAVLGDLDVKVLDPAVRDFIEQYCVLQSIQLDENGTESSISRFYTEATKANAAMLAESRSVYDSLSPAQQQQIETICLEHGMDYDALSQKACALIQQQAAQGGENPSTDLSQQPAGNTAGASSQKASDSAAEQKTDSDASLTVQEPAEEKKQGGPADPAASANPSVQNEKNQDDKQEDTAASNTAQLAILPDGTIIRAEWTALDEAAITQQQSLLARCKELQAAKNAAIAQIVFTADLNGQKAEQTVYGLNTDSGQIVYSVNPAENGQPESIQLYDPAFYSYNFDSGKFALKPSARYVLAAQIAEPEEETPKNDLLETEETVQPSDSVSDPLDAAEKKNAEQKAAEEAEQKTMPDQNSVQSAWQDAKADKNKAQSFVDRYCTVNGSVIKKADASNAQKILDGYESWSAMSQSEKNAVNALLKSSGSISFQSLYTQANEIRLGLPATSVDEESSDDAAPKKPVSVQTGWMPARTLISLGAASAAAGMLLLARSRKQETPDHPE